MKESVQRRIIKELRRLSVLFVYLALLLAAFQNYRRLILAEYKITYAHYGYSLIEALILAKVIMLGDYLQIGRRFRHSPLIVTTLYKTVAFAILVVVFSIFEHLVIGFLHGEDLARILQAIASKGKDEILAQFVVMFAVFVPLFALWEIGETMGERRLFELFFKRRPVEEADGSGGSKPDPPG